MKKLYNQDLKQDYENIINKYKKIDQILKKDDNIINKQKNIENYCMNNFNVNISLKKNYINDIITSLEKELKEIQNDFKSKKITEFIEHKENFIKIIILIMTHIIVENNIKNKSEEIPYTKFLMKLKNDLIKQDRYEKYPRLYDFKKYTFSLKDSETFTLMEALMHILIKIEVIIIKTKRIKIKTKKFISFNEKIIFNSYKYYIKMNNIPMVVKPLDWQIESATYVNGGYISISEDLKDTLIHYNKDYAKESKISLNFLNNLNYLQKIPYEINKSYLKYMENNIDEILLNENIFINKYKDYEDYEKKYIEIEKYIRTNYNNERSKAITFIELIYLANLFKDNTLYYTVYLDFRNRIYYNGYLLSPQGNSYSKKLIKFKNIDQKNIISMDATASGMQIFGILLKNKKYLELTNVTTNIDNKDIYDFYRLKFNQKYNQNIDKRKTFKPLLMCYGYNQTLVGMSKMYHKINSSNEFKDNVKTMKKLQSFFSEEFHDIEELKKIIKKTVKSSDSFLPIKLFNYKNSYIASQFYVKQKIHRYTYIGHDKKKKLISLRINENPLKRDFLKAYRATLVNLVHCLDAFIAHSIIKYCKENNMLITTIHDCFIIEKKHIEIINDQYKKAIKELLEMNIIENFIEKNANITEKVELKENYKKIIGQDKIENFNIKILKEEQIYDHK